MSLGFYPIASQAIAGMDVTVVAGTSATLEWFTHPWERLPPKGLFAEQRPALTLTPDTLPPRIAGMSWFERWSTDPVTKPTFTTPLARNPVNFPTRISGISWFERWSKDPVTGPTYSQPQPMWVSPLGLPAPISGMAWFTPPDRDKKAVKIWIEIPPERGLPTNSELNSNKGIPWFERWAKDPTTKPVFTQPRAGVVTEGLIPPVIEGMEWFEPPDRDKKAIKVHLEAIPGYVNIPPELVSKIKGMAWFEPWDRDKKATKVSLESLPAHVLRELPPYVFSIIWIEQNSDIYPGLSLIKYKPWVDVSRPAQVFRYIPAVIHEPEADYRPFRFERRNVRSMKLPLYSRLR